MLAYQAAGEVLSLGSFEPKLSYSAPIDALNECVDDLSTIQPVSLQILYRYE
jgi:hypothetical protein